jgi:stress response protein SCP2
MRRFLSFAIALGILVPAQTVAQRQGDVDAINRLIDRYGALEDAMDMNAQAQLMSADRVWIGQGTGRRTDQATNMRIQQAAFDQLKKRLPGVQTFTEDRDRLVKFYGNGSVAVASFFRYTTLIVPPTTTPDVAKEFGPVPAGAITLVLEKRDGDWKIVHTHFSDLAPPQRQ